MSDTPKESPKVEVSKPALEIQTDTSMLNKVSDSIRDVLIPKYDIFARSGQSNFAIEVIITVADLRTAQSNKSVSTTRVYARGNE